jgi:molecular chaperone DnaK
MQALHPTSAPVQRARASRSNGHRSHVAATNATTTPGGGGGGGGGGGPSQRRRLRRSTTTGRAPPPPRGPPTTTTTTAPPPPARNNPAELVVGIDLGTTNSAVARVDPRTGAARCVPNARGDTLTPSVVAFLPGGAPPLVGLEARRQAAGNPCNTYSSVKRLIGRRRDDPAVEEEARRLSARGGGKKGGGGGGGGGGGRGGGTVAAQRSSRIVADEEGAAVLLCDHTPTGTLYPEEVSALVLARLLEDAEREDAEIGRQGEGGGSEAGDDGDPAAAAAARRPRRITKAVISVPAYFDDAQRDATVQAGRLAGLETVRLIREPVAAALAYGVDLQRRAARRAERRGGGGGGGGGGGAAATGSGAAGGASASSASAGGPPGGDDEPDEQTILVFDLGGGTLDVSLLEVGGGTIEVLSTGGDARLGGDDWDAAVVAWLREQVGGGLPAGGGGGGGGGDDDDDDGGAAKEEDAALAARLKALAEYAKVQLSEADAVDLSVPAAAAAAARGSGAAAAAGAQSRKVVRLTRAKLDELSAPLFRRARLPLDAACWQAGIDLNEAVAEADRKRAALAKKGAPAWKRQMVRPDVRPRVGSRAPVSRVLLVGGATRMPSVAAFVRNMTGLEESCIIGGSGGGRTLAAAGRGRGGGGGSGGQQQRQQQQQQQLVDPDEAVALGAAVQAGVLQGEVGDVMVLDQWQASLMRAAAQLALQQQGQQQQQGAEGGAAAAGGAAAPEAADGGRDDRAGKVAALRRKLAREYDMSEAPAQLRSALQAGEEEEEEDEKGDDEEEEEELDWETVDLGVLPLALGDDGDDGGDDGEALEDESGTPR